MHKYLKVMSISMKNSVVYLKDFLLGNTFIILIIIVYILLWNNLYSQNVRTGFTFKELIWYLIINQTVFTNNMELFRKIEDDIKSGNIAYHLNKPYSYVVFTMFEALGKIIVRFGTNASFGLLLGLVFIGPIPAFRLVNVIPMLIMMALGVILNLLIYILISMTSFWFEENAPFVQVYRQLVFAFGGFLVPLTLFPDKLYKIMEHMPWTYVAFHTSNSSVHFSLQGFINTVSGQLLYIGLFTLLNYLVYRKGAEALNVNGG